jgi:hypothetical protein
VEPRHDPQQVTFADCRETVVHSWKFIIRSLDRAGLTKPTTSELESQRRPQLYRQRFTQLKRPE